MKGFLKKLYSSKCRCYKCMILYHSVYDLIVCKCPLTTLNWLAWLLMCKNDQNRANIQMSFLWEFKVLTEPSSNKYVPRSINSVMRPRSASPFQGGSADQARSFLSWSKSPLKQGICDLWGSWSESVISGVCAHPLSLSWGCGRSHPQTLFMSSFQKSIGVVLESPIPISSHFTFQPSPLA